MQQTGIGIIGGADGPTKVFVTTAAVSPILTFAAIAVIVCVVIGMVLYKKKKN